MRKRVSRLIVGVIIALMVAGFHSMARAEERRSTFALIVTNNRSTRLSRPDLRYADDDGAKYYATFRMLAPESNVVLLTTFDADSEKLFPDLVTKVRAPSAENVRGAAASLVARIQAAKTHGPVDFYFIFAGHGDVDHGKGFLEFEDGPFTADDLHGLVRSIPATSSHVILDSCNAFFAVQARKPGGRHFVTSEEAQRGLAERLPDTGVFLSTSAEGNVYEWSSIQSGIFSHAVRSGLAGAADADGNGHVTYDELRAFVESASKDVKNPAYRPQVFARGPGGRGNAELFDLTRAAGKRLRIDERQRRLTVRDGLDVPWFDLHKEAGKSATLLLPARLSGGGAVEETSASGVRTRYPVQLEEQGEEVALASLAVSPPSTDARGGADEIFQSLFARPFGPKAYAEFIANQTTASPLVLGVSPDERERFRLLLQEAADSASRRRVLLGSARMGIAVGAGVTGGLTLEKGIRFHDAQRDVLGGLFLAIGGAFSVTNFVGIVRPSSEERTHEAFSRSLALAPDTLQAQKVFAEAERCFLEAAEEDRSERIANRWMGFGVAALSTGLLALAVNDVRGDLTRLSPAPTLLFAGEALFGVGLAIDSFFPTTTERMANVWRSDPDLVRLQNTSALHVTPTLGVLGVGIHGTF